MGGVSGFFPLTILGVCLAGTSAILNQDTADVSNSNDLNSVNKKLKSMKDAVDATTAGISKVDVGSTFSIIQLYFFLVNSVLYLLKNFLKITCLNYS